MKKALFLLLMCLPMTTLAQEIGLEELTSVLVKGDPMLDTKDRTVWQSAHIRIDEGKFGPVITLKCEGHIFISNVPKIGMYDENDNLLGMSFFCTYSMPTQDGRYFQIMGAIHSKDSIPGSSFIDKKNYYGMSIKDLLTETKMNKRRLRIVSKTYGGYIYDISFRFKEE